MTSPIFTSQVIFSRSLLNLQHIYFVLILLKQKLFDSTVYLQNLSLELISFLDSSIKTTSYHMEKKGTSLSFKAQIWS